MMSEKEDVESAQRRAHIDVVNGARDGLEKVLGPFPRSIHRFPVCEAPVEFVSGLVRQKLVFLCVLVVALPLCIYLAAPRYWMTIWTMVMTALEFLALASIAVTLYYILRFKEDREK